MKTNKMLRLASILMVAAMISTCAISGTFAKYVTSDDVADEARVAKWGVTVTGSGYLFAETYKEATENTPGGDAAVLTVVSSNGDKVVAPGSKSNDDGMNINISGIPEVDVKVEHNATVTLTGWEIESEFYCPLIFTINSEIIDGKTFNNSADLIDKLTDAIENKSTVKYDANTDLGAQPNNQINITWEWPFELSDENNIKDTKLGNLSTAPEISIGIVTTVTQID